jgi:hypothetical protein
MIEPAGSQDDKHGHHPKGDVAAQPGQAPFSIQALPASYQGEEAGSQVWISPDAAGWGWSVGTSMSTGRVDPGSVLDHGSGRVVAQEDSDKPS